MNQDELDLGRASELTRGNGRYSPETGGLQKAAGIENDD